MGSPETQCISFSQSPSHPSPSHPSPSHPSDSPIPEPDAPEPRGPGDERFRYGLTAKGRAYLAELQHAEADLDRAERRRRRARRARAAGRRFGTVCGRYRTTGRTAGRVPDLRLSGKWLRDSGFDLGQEFEVEVRNGKLVIQAV